jgi:hypothetical protein
MGCALISSISPTITIARSATGPNPVSEQVRSPREPDHRARHNRGSAQPSVVPDLHRILHELALEHETRHAMGAEDCLSRTL